MGNKKSEKSAHVSCHCDVKTGEVIFYEICPASQAATEQIIDTNLKAFGLSIMACLEVLKRYEPYVNDPTMKDQIEKNVPMFKAKIKILSDFAKRKTDNEINDEKRISYKKFYKMQRTNKNII